LENSNKIKSEFLSVISHELRTPLNIIMGYAALTKNDPVSAANEQHHIAMQKIETQAKCLLDVINSIIEATDIESGASHVTKRAVDVGELFERLQAAYDSPQLKNLALI
jgi:K+-sensing histidine kinase KdpD